MKKFIKVVTLSTLYLMSCSAAFSAELRYKIKCDVEMLGGENALYFAVIPHKNIALIESSLPGSKKSLGASTEKKEIYKVNECLDLKTPFRREAARYLESIADL